MLHAYIFGGAESETQDKLSQRGAAWNLLVQDVWPYQKQDGVCHNEGPYQVWPGKVHCLFDEKDQGRATRRKHLLNIGSEDFELYL